MNDSMVRASQIELSRAAVKIYESLNLINETLIHIETNLSELALQLGTNNQTEVDTDLSVQTMSSYSPSEVKSPISDTQVFNVNEIS